MSLKDFDDLDVFGDLDLSPPVEDPVIPKPDLATRVTLARIRTIEDATEMDLIQYMLARGGSA